MQKSVYAAHPNREKSSEGGKVGGSIAGKGRPKSEEKVFGKNTKDLSSDTPRNARVEAATLASVR